MVENIQFNPMFKLAMHQVFGYTLICRDMDKASYFAKNYNHDTVTLEGGLCAHVTPMSLIPNVHVHLYTCVCVSR